MSTVLWKPDGNDVSRSQMVLFMQRVNAQQQLSLDSYEQLHQWSIKHPSAFWQAISDDTDVHYHTPAKNIIQTDKHMLDTRWFSAATLNYAENCLRQPHDHIAIIETDESGHTRHITYAELTAEVNRVAHHLRFLGVTPQDRVAAILSNKASTIIAMLATTSIGATWSSCSPEFGYGGLIDRLEQINPRVLFTSLTHTYNGKTFDHLEKIQRCQQKLNLKQTIVIGAKQTTSQLDNSIHLNDLPQPAGPIEFTAVPFDHPLFILFSSGTTGQPKCIVHGTGGTLLQHKKEHILHCDIRPQEVLFFYTTTGWMMWNWMASALACGATIVCYNGNPAYQRPDRLFDLIDDFSINHFGVAAKLIENISSHHCQPNKKSQFDSLKSIMTTGSPLLPSSFDFVYQYIKQNVRLSSISGGTDIISCFALGNPMLPVYRGQLQCLGLGMDVRVLNKAGKAVINEKGELVCCSAFPSMPVCFLNDPDRAKYHAAYFVEFDNTWAHKDYAMITKEGGMIIIGRSDTTLNPGGIRIGTAEIYRQLQKIDCITEAIAVSHNTIDGEKIALFVQLKESHQLDNALINKIKNTIREGTSPHHVPHVIHAVADLPRTLNGKLSETAVKKTLHGETINNTSALLNPECLTEIRRFHHSDNNTTT